MDNVFLYLLGAGASCQILPLASDFAKRLASFANDLKMAGPKNVYGEPSASPDDPVWGKNRDNLYDAINWLATESSHHFSIDTFAKKLFFRGDTQSLKKLKAALSVYLVIEQSRQHVDQRYDAFLASVLRFDSSRRVSLPDHLHIFTWNYDTQLDKAFYGFCENQDMVIEHVTFSNRIYRINGRCGTHPPGTIGDPFCAVLNTKSEPAWEAGINLYKEYISEPSSPEPEINFAWEDPTHNKLKNVGLNLLSNVSDIVVIGYSFPYFNREIDDIIFKQFSHIRRIYLQYPMDVHTSIENRIRGLLPPDVEIIRVASTDLFYIPDDF
ncbi:MAG: hypothetical protein HZA11_04645 [Nitrospirae bacterium]|nr:hypothetical protein [Nitrospirota bacterium]